MKADLKTWLLQLQDIIHLPFLIRYDQHHMDTLLYIEGDLYKENYLLELDRQQTNQPLSIIKINRVIYVQIKISDTLKITTYQNNIESFASYDKLNFLLKSMSFIYFSLTNKKLDIKKYINDEKVEKIIFPRIEEEMMESREEKKYHANYIHELYLIQCIHHGDNVQLERAMENFKNAGNKGLLAKEDSLRNKKNKIIPVVTLATRAAIEGGVPQEQAYKLSDLYIQSIEEKKFIDDVSSISYNILADFTNLVKQYKRKNLTKNIYLCQEHINTHLYEKISLQVLANILKMNASYLSFKFKEETGIKLTDYIHIQKIEEAKKLLLLSKYQISEIYTLLNFTDQSHFNRVFKKIEGITPNHYKEIYFLK